jgi:hypothetical protein
MPNATSLVSAVGLAATGVGVTWQLGRATRLARGLRTGVGRALRNTADLIDRQHAPRGTHLSFTIERGQGLRIRHDHRGCPLWYLDDDYKRAFSEAGDA